MKKTIATLLLLAAPLWAAPALARPLAVTAQPIASSAEVHAALLAMRYPLLGAGPMPGMRLADPYIVGGDGTLNFTGNIAVSGTIGGTVTIPDPIVPTDGNQGITGGLTLTSSLSFTDANARIAETGTNDVTITADGAAQATFSSTGLDIAGDFSGGGGKLLYQSGAACGGCDSFLFMLGSNFATEGATIDVTADDVNESPALRLTNGGGTGTSFVRLEGTHGADVLWDNSADDFIIRRVDSGVAGATLLGIDRTTGTVDLATALPITEGGTGQTTATAAFDALAPTTTQGDISYHNGTDNVRLAKGTGLQQLRMNAGATAPEWAAGASGDVVGPASATDNAVVRFDGTTGKLIQNWTSNAPTCTDSGNCSWPGGITANGGISALTNSNNIFGVNTYAYLGAANDALRVQTTANVSTTAVGNIGAGVDPLISYTLVANSLTQAGRGIRLTAWGSVANVANAKTITCGFGATSTTLAGVSNVVSATSGANNWKVVVEIARTGASTQDMNGLLTGNIGATSVFTYDQEIATAALTETSTIAVGCMCEATNNNDCVQEGMTVEAL